MNKANLIKAAVAALSGLASSFFHAYGAIFICVCIIHMCICINSFCSFKFRY